MGPNQTDKLSHSKGNHKPTEWEKIISNDASKNSGFSKQEQDKVFGQYHFLSHCIGDPSRTAMQEK